MKIGLLQTLPSEAMPIKVYAQKVYVRQRTDLSFAKPPHLIQTKCGRIIFVIAPWPHFVPGAKWGGK